MPEMEMTIIFLVNLGNLTRQKLEANFLTFWASK